MSDLYTSAMKDCTVIVGNSPLKYTEKIHSKKINYIYIVDYINFNHFNKLINILKTHSTKYFVIITEHCLPLTFFDNYKNIYCINYIYNKNQIFNKLNKDPLGITHMKGEQVAVQSELFATCNTTSISDNMKDFSILLGNKNPLDRHRIYSFLQYFNILSKCNYTIKKNADFYHLYNTYPDLFENRLNDAYTSIPENVVQIGENAYRYRFRHKQNIKIIADVIKNSNIYVALENQPLDLIGAHITEKSMYGFIFKKPTLHIGLPDNVNVLERMGFKGFAPVLSQGFNKIKNSNEKIIALCKEMQFIQNVDRSFLTEWYAQVESIIKHNRKVVENLPTASLTEWKAIVLKAVAIEETIISHTIKQ
jgi:hypothetical protein